MRHLQKLFPMALAVALLIISTGMRAQTITGVIVGTVTDISGAFVPAAKVVATNRDTNMTTETVTNGTGEYEIPNLVPGNYNIKISKVGLDSSSVEGVDVQASRSIRADSALRAGSSEATISVVARQATINTEDATIGNILQGTIIQQLPVNGRTADKLLRLSAGVASDNTSSGTNPRISGSSYYGGTQFNVDGLTYNDAANGGAAYSSQGLNTMPPIDAIQEFKVDSSNAKAEYTGTVSVILVTKSGSNRFHGSVYEFNRNKAFAAINTFTATQPKPKFNRNEFGGVVSGPVINNKLFFMGYYEGYTERSARAIVSSVAPQTLRNGDFSDPSLTTPGLSTYTILRDPQTGLPFYKNIIPMNRISPAALAILKFTPLPNGPGTGPAGTVSNFLLNTPNSYNVHRYGIKLDYVLSDKDHLSLSYFRSASGTYIQALGYPPGYGSFSNAGFRTTSTNGTWIHIFNEHLVNEARVGVFEHHSIRKGVNLDANPSAIIPGLYTPLPYGGVPEARVSGFTSIGDYGGAETNQHTYQIVDNMTYVIGSHAIKAGVDLVRDYVTRPANALGASFLTGAGNYAFGRFDFNGQYTKGSAGANSINALADFLLGDPTATYRSTPAVRAGGKNPHYDFFAQDDWRVRPNLTLTYGLRYQLQQPWSTDGSFSNYDPTLNALVVQGNTFPTTAQPRLIAAYPIITQQAAGYGSNYLIRDSGDWSPRLGFAYRPLNNDRIAIRGGAGIYYNLFPFFAGMYQLAQNNPPFFLSETFSAAAGYTPSLSLNSPYPGNGAISPNPNVSGVQRQLRNGRSNQWNLSVDNALTNTLGFRLSYVGNRTNHLTYNGENINLPNVQMPVAVQTELPHQPFNSIAYTSFGGDAYYHQLQAELIMRSYHGLNFQAEYGWTRSTDDVPINGGPQNPNNPRADRGNSDALHRHVFSLAYSYALPFGAGKQFLNRNGVLNEIVGGWELTGIDVLETGAPFSVSFSASGTGFLSSRANLVGDPKAISNPGRAKWFNTAAYTAPAYLSYGNSPRNGIFAPGSVQVDAGVLKNFKLTERANFQFRAEAFNALNHVNLSTPAANVSVPSSFGLISGTSTDMRVLQFAGKVTF